MITVMSRQVVMAASALAAAIGITGVYYLLNMLYKIRKSNADKLDLPIEVTEGLYSLQKDLVLSSSTLSLTSTSSSKLRRNGFETEDEMYSAIGSEIDEFYDLTSDDEEYSIKSSKEYKPCANQENACNLFEEVDVLLKGSDEDRLNALKMLEQEENQYCENSNFLWRMAKAHQMQATAFGAKNDNEKKKEYVCRGLAYAAKALAMDPSNSDAHKWYAILVGMKGQFLPMKEKIQSGFTFQTHLEASLNGRPDDPTLYHLLGRFKYEIANLSWIEKKMASALFAQLPDLTMDDALADFKIAEELNPNPWKENRLLVAKCYIGLGKYVDALEWLNSTVEIDPVTHEDRVCDEECQSLLVKYQKYGNRMNKSI